MTNDRAVVRIQNSQMYGKIMSPGWTLSWTWAKKEVIWSMVGAQATDQGDCSKFKGDIPHCCKRSPTIVELLPGGVLNSWGQDPSSAVSAFQLSVGLAGTSNKTVKPPKNFVLLGPGPGYTCGPTTIIVPSSVFLSADGRKDDSKISSVVTSDRTELKEIPPVIQCTQHMCPIRVHWYVKANYKEYWKVKITVTNFDYWKNYTQWTLVVQHPNLNNLTNAYNFVYKPLNQYKISSKFRRVNELMR
ncbi:COBRA-like protein [Parasponia andersonii]|uniref:COBRA-like protein n=1 Tax=Parasponia andersonii TaxID=3476 RepID=A0A2P5BN13_PARAD|nr:COBRA-like protein [Parasponia andersonii]